jgi:hypothetical protein
MDKEILTKMILEEYRIHSSLFGGRLFAFFPILVFLCCLIASSQIELFTIVLSYTFMFQSLHFVFLFIGVSIGAFGLYGKEILNRRFGQASLLAYSSQTLPISERKIFFSFILKDIIYYMMLWILPILAGLILGSMLSDVPLSSALFGSLTLLVTFLLGLSFSFFLSTLYAHSSKITILLLLSVFFYIIFFKGYMAMPLSSLLFSYTLFFQPTPIIIGLCLFFILIPIFFSLVFVKIDYPLKKKAYANIFSPLHQKLGFTKQYSIYLSKDLIDLYRSEGGLGKVIFQFLLPVIFTWLFLYVFTKIIPEIQAVMIFSIFLGVVSSSLYTLLTAFDSFNPYMILPVKVSTIIKSKIINYLFLNSISLIILLAASLSLQEFDYFIAALCVFITLSLYCLFATIYFTGLQPSILMYNSKIFLSYILITGPLLFGFTILSIIYPYYLYASPIFILPGLFLLKKSYKKWDKWTPLSI